MNRDAEITIVDIAKALGISAATVSRSLHDHPRISSRTKERVRKKAEEMGYRHNKLASGLRNRKTHTVGLIVPRISMYFHSVFITAVQNKLHEKGYNLIIGQSNDSYDLEMELAATLYSSRVDALVTSTTLYTEDFSHFDGFVKNNIPLVFYDRVPTGRYPAQVVKGDDYRGGYLAGTHLAETGCKSIAHISGPLSCNIYKDRLAGFTGALEEHGLALPESRMYFHELTYENARKTLRKMFAKKPFPDGLFTANDTTAIAALEFARKQGIGVPRELKVVGYSNDPRTAIIAPSITTIDQYPETMADQVVTVLMEMLDKKQKRTVHVADPIVTPVTLVQRKSTYNQ